MATADVNGIALAHDIDGPADGPPLVLVYGMRGSRLSWPPALRQPLLDAGLRLITLDNRDAGESTWFTAAGPADLGEIMSTLRAGGTPGYAYTLADMAADTIGLLDHLEIDAAHLLGMSMGGMIVQRIAIDHPDRVLSLTSVMSTTGARGLPRAAPEATAALMTAAEEPGLAGLLAVRQHRRAAYGSPGFDHDPEFDLWLAERTLEVGVDPDAAGRQFAATIADGDRTEGLRGLEVPALVVHGAEDRLIRPEAGEATAAAIPGARLVMVEGMGHDLPPGVCATLADEVLALIGR